MRILYGVKGNALDVTEICKTVLMYDNIIAIPSGEASRAQHFTDPLPYVVKSIFVQMDELSEIIEFDPTVRIRIHSVLLTIETSTDAEIDAKIAELHSKLVLNHGSFNDELPEQKMAIRYLTGKEKVLEIGGNIGRNSLIIASLLENSANLVTLESNPHTAAQLTENRDANQFHFHVEPSALSVRPLTQQGWTTLPTSDGNGQNVTIMDWLTLQAKYSIVFDTLVLDCEGAFYYILQDMPEMLNNIQLILMENDYTDLAHKRYIDNVLRTRGFYRDYVESGGWYPCTAFFFEVWKKSVTAKM